MSVRLLAAREALKLGLCLSVLSTLAAIGPLAKTNIWKSPSASFGMRSLFGQGPAGWANDSLSRTLNSGAAAVGPALPNALAPIGFGTPAGAAPDLPPGTAEAINARLPFAADPLMAAKPFVLRADAGTRARALQCLAQAVYYEAASEPLEGQRAVAQVVLNRVRHPIFPHSVCGVVYQGSELPTGCQFSFTCDGSLSRPLVGWAWKNAEMVAREALAGRVVPEVGEATHYHTDWVAPYWMRTVTKVAQIGAHIFYRWPGALGQPGAFTARYAGVERLPAPKLKPSAIDPAPVAVASTATGETVTPVPVAVPGQPALSRGRLRFVVDANGYGVGMTPAPAPARAQPTAAAPTAATPAQTDASTRAPTPAAVAQATPAAG